MDTNATALSQNVYNKSNGLMAMRFTPIINTMEQVQVKCQGTTIYTKKLTHSYAQLKQPTS